MSGDLYNAQVGGDGRAVGFVGVVSRGGRGVLAWRTMSPGAARGYGGRPCVLAAVGDFASSACGRELPEGIARGIDELRVGRPPIRIG